MTEASVNNDTQTELVQLHHLAQCKAMPQGTYTI
jgi:hypothetical protein